MTKSKVDAVDANDIYIDEEVLNLLSCKRVIKSLPKARGRMKRKDVVLGDAEAERIADKIRSHCAEIKILTSDDLNKLKEKIGSGLSGRYKSGIKPHTMNAIRKGLPPKSSNEIKRVLGINDKILAEMLGISEKTVQRKRSKREKFSLVESDRLYRLAHITALAINVLGSEENAKEWLGFSQYDLAGEIPLDAMKTEIGAREVEDALNRLKFGIFA
ncbi:MAG TPA: DUF2384 domain-containing protein [Nitrospirae bacterium]|nr:DUF2384 domain-containing protein [Nitrospirota bacterium]